MAKFTAPSGVPMGCINTHEEHSTAPITGLVLLDLDFEDFQPHIDLEKFRKVAELAAQTSESDKVLSPDLARELAQPYAYGIAVLDCAVEDENLLFLTHEDALRKPMKPCSPTCRWRPPQRNAFPTRTSCSSNAAK